MTGELFRVRGLNAHYGKSQVIHDLNLSVQPGELATILGRNGAGKTSLIMAIAGLVRARCEELVLGGRDLRGEAAYRRVRSGLAVVPSGSRGFGNLTVHENLETVVGTGSGEGWTVAEVYERFPRLGERRSSLGWNLSGGERQMLAIGRAMVSCPKLLLMDEPSEGLAPLVVKQLVQTLRDLTARGLGIILTEQSHKVALEVADRAHFIEKGQIVWSGTVEQARASGAVNTYLGV